MGPRNNVRNLSRQSSLKSVTSASTNKEGRDLIIWDIAIACLALSVKVTLIRVFGAMSVADWSDGIE